MKTDVGFGVEIEIYDYLTIRNTWNEKERVE